MWTKVLEVVAQYGPFPVGIIVGIYISERAMKHVIAFSEKENKALRLEKKELHDTIREQNNRIETLHEKLLPIN